MVLSTKDYLKPVIYKIYKIYLQLKLDYSTWRIRKKRKNCVFLLASPCHGNLGDQAIVFAENMLLTDSGFGRQIIEIDNNNYLRFKDTVKKKITEDDIIIIDGGGNLGTLWPEEDDKISNIIKDYPSNKIIIFPQTCYYQKDKAGLERLSKNKEIYEDHKDLLVLLREQQSYIFFQEVFPSVNCMLLPDIALYIKYTLNNAERQGVLLCFRKDKEKTFPEADISGLKNFIKALNLTYKETDTVIGEKISHLNRTRKLKKKWNEFLNSGLVITDRLHGMIFAVITGTPCICVDNKSKKISGVYQWVSTTNNIVFCDNIESIKKNISVMYRKKTDLQSIHLQSYFKTITDEIEKDILNENTQ